jgi:hypothetical protein
VVHHFLDEYARFGAFRGVAGRGFQWQKLENAALRSRHGVPPDASGVLLARLDPLAPSSINALRARDILLTVEGVPIADDGTVAFRGAERLDFTHLWRQRHCGDTLHAVVLRDGARAEVAFEVARPRPLVPILHTVDCTPSYYIVGGLVFIPLSVPFLEHGYGASWRKVTPVKLQALLAEYRTQPDQEVVLLFQILSAELNYGYKGTSLWVNTFNGVKVRNLAQMAALVEVRAQRACACAHAQRSIAHARTHACSRAHAHALTRAALHPPRHQSATGPWLEWETDDGSCIVLDRAEAVANSGVILAQHAIAQDRSADLRGEAAAAIAMECDKGDKDDKGANDKGGDKGGGAGPVAPPAPEETPPPAPPAPSGGDASEGSPPGGGSGSKGGAAASDGAAGGGAAAPAPHASQASPAAASPPRAQETQLPEEGADAAAAEPMAHDAEPEPLPAPPAPSQSVRPGDPCGDFGAPAPAATPKEEAMAQAAAAVPESAPAQRGGVMSPLPCFAPRRAQAAYARVASSPEPIASTAPF